MQQLPGHFPLDQIVLRASADRLLAEILVLQARQHHDGGIRLLPEQPVEAVEAPRVGQAKVEQHAGSAGYQLPGISEHPHPLHQHASARLVEQFLNKKGVAIVVFNQQNPQLLRVTRHQHPLKEDPAGIHHLSARKQPA